MSISVNIHPESFRAHAGGPSRTTVWVNIQTGDGGSAVIFLMTPELCDELAEAAATAKQLLAAAEGEGK